jgi:hypothetical protein
MQKFTVLAEYSHGEGLYFGCNILDLRSCVLLSVERCVTKV